MSDKDADWRKWDWEKDDISRGERADVRHEVVKEMEGILSLLNRVPRAPLCKYTRHLLGEAADKINTAIRDEVANAHEDLRSPDDSIYS